MTDKTDLDYAHEALEIGDEIENGIELSQAWALLSIAGSLARLVELTEVDQERQTEWQERVNKAESAREASLQAREAEGRSSPWTKDDRFNFNPGKPPGEQYTYKSQSAGQSLPPEILETLVDQHGTPVGTTSRGYEDLSEFGEEPRIDQGGWPPQSTD